MWLNVIATKVDVAIPLELAMGHVILFGHHALFEEAAHTNHGIVQIDLGPPYNLAV